MQYKEAIEHINSITRFGNRKGVECSKAVLEKLGHPEHSFPVIHVAGTNGKGSVCAYLTGILRASGVKVGTFTSPHLVRENERIRYCGEDISDEMFADCFAQVHQAELALLTEGFGQITYFDFFLATALIYFQRVHADAVILETGMGGLYDSTNAVEKPMLSIITSISLDHTSVLGNTTEQIALQKAGIIKEGVPLVYIRGEQYSHVLEEIAAKKHSVAYGVEKSQCIIRENTDKYIDFSIDNLYYKDSVFRIATPALYQVVNAALAAQAAEVLTQNGIFGTITREKVKAGLYRTRWEGRMEEISPHIYVDGAHNPDGIDCFIKTARSLKTMLKGRFVCLFSVVRDKQYAEMIYKLCDCGIFDTFLIAPLEGERHLDLDELGAEFCSHMDKPVFRLPSVFEAAQQARRMRDEGCIIMCAGSLYLAGELKRLAECKEKNND